MVERLKSALRNPVSPLVLKAAALAVAIFWLRLGDISFLKLTAFGAVFLFFYLKPSLGIGKFVASAVVLLINIFLAPQVSGPIGFYVNLSLGTLGFLLLGVKNLIFIRRQSAYHLMQLVLMVGLASLFSLGLISQILFFILAFFLFREFYLIMTPEKPELISLVSALEGMLVMQVAWVTSFFPSSFLVSAAFMVLLTFISHDALVNYFKGTFSAKIAWRSLAVFALLALLILSLPVWGFN
ncbi:MAG: hypothetical protein Q8P99_03050 [bacterium]|nr:hypothetical protein [bacterium]MDZ4231328.1 hypothetical protein [Patescibacteria group bacterium]